MAKTANEEILDATVRHQMKVLRFSDGEALRASKLLGQSDGELVRMLETELTEASRTRLKGLLGEVRRMREAAAEAVGDQLRESLGEFASVEAEWEVAMLHGATPIAYGFSSASPATLKAVAGNPINGVPLKGWLGKIAENDISRIEQQINLGVLQGETVQQMVARLRGTKSNNYADGVLSMTRREAEMVVRTGVSQVSTDARQATWAANADVISGLRWVATLDGRTSSTCQSLDGEVYPLDSGPRPPAHPNCRSSMAPVLIGEEIVGDRPTVKDTRTRANREVDFRAEAKAEAGEAWSSMTPKERDAGVKARRIKWAAENVGQVPSSTTYQQWLTGQSEAFQNDVLGKGKAELFRAGMPLKKFVDERGRPYSLARLQAETSGDKLFVVQPGVGLAAKAYLQQGLSSQEVLARIKQAYPDAHTSLASIASYKTELNKAGALNLPMPDVPSAAVAKAKSVADIVRNFEAALPENVKQAIGGQWSTVVGTLDGAPGAYSYYEAGKGVVLSGEKLAAISAAQAQQVTAHELGHLLHKQHELLLPDEAWKALKAASAELTPGSKKLYSYYLSHTDELVAEVYAQALSPSPLTSQGLSAIEFNKAYGASVQAAKKALADKFPIPMPGVKPPLPGGPVLPFEVAGKHTSVGSLAKALLQQGLPDDQVLKSVLAEFPQAKTKAASIASYKSELKKAGALSPKGLGPVVSAKPLPGVVAPPPPVKAAPAKAAPAKAAPAKAAPAKAAPAKAAPSTADVDKAWAVLTVSGKAGEAATSILAAGGTASEAAAAAAKAISWKPSKSYLDKLVASAQIQLDATKLSAKPYLAAVSNNSAAAKAVATAEVKAGKKAGKKDQVIVPSRTASTPRDGRPPPPRFDDATSLRAVQSYLGSASRTSDALINKVNAAQRAAGLPELVKNEIAAIRGYTGYGFVKLNTSLRSGAYASSLPLQATVESAQRALSKMKKYVGECTRGVRVPNDVNINDIIGAYSKGGVVEEQAFVSTARGGFSSFEGAVTFKIQSKNGVGVEGISAFPREREVLFMPGTRFKCTEIIDEGKDRARQVTIYLTEVD